MNVNYYIIGSKYQQQDKSWVDVFPGMLEKECVSVGWASEHNLNSFYGKPEGDIVKYLKTKNEPPESYSTLERFLNLKPGDLIAVKESGSPVGNQPRLVIRAYAVVVERNGQVYAHDPKGLGHLINIEFLEVSLSKAFSLGYGRTIHHLVNNDHIKQIFDLYSRALETEQRKKGRSSKGITKKKATKQRRSGSAAYVADAAHDRLQQDVYDHLCKLYGKQGVRMEESNVDITLHRHNVTTFYEIKPYSTAKQCIREALGQLIEYSWNVSIGDKYLNLAIVGPSKPSASELKYIKYVKENLRLPIKYLSYTKGSLVDYEV